MIDLVIVGAGGHARELLDIVEAVNAATPTFRFAGFLADEEAYPERSAARNATILGGVDLLSKLTGSYVIGVGDLKARKRIDKVASKAGLEPATLIHPDAVLGSMLDIGPGCCIAAGAVLTTNIKMGRHTHVNVSASISHDCSVGDWCLVGPGARLAGNVSIGDGVELGIGAVVRPGIRIGDWALVGAGASVVSDVAPDITVAGVPAKPLT